MHRHKTFLACGSSAPVRAESEGGAAASLAGTLAVCRDIDCLCCTSYGPIRVFFRASCSWQSEGLFGQSFSVAPTIQAFKRIPYLGSFSVVWCVRHIEGALLTGTGVLLCRSAHQALKGAPWVGSYSVVQCLRHLMGQPLYCSSAITGMWRERGYGDGSICYV